MMAPKRTSSRACSVLVIPLLVSSAPMSLLADDGAHFEVRECLADEPADYREADFRSLVPCTLAGATVLSTVALQQLLAAEAGAWLIDVMPSPRKPASLGADALWLPLPRDNIEGSTWLPNTGFGLLPVEEASYLRVALSRMRDDAPGRPLVFYCEANCWMSWNAAKRALEWGFEAVHWYPEGIDGWRDAGQELVSATPAPGR